MNKNVEWKSAATREEPHRSVASEAKTQSHKANIDRAQYTIVL